MTTVKDYITTLTPYRQIGWDTLSEDDRSYYKQVCNAMLNDHEKYIAPKGTFKYELINKLLDEGNKPKMGRTPDASKL